MVNTVLFDLDGTLADTAPDLAFALNQTLKNHGKNPLAYEQIRPVVSHGGKALIELGFQISADTDHFESLRLELLDIYKANIATHTTLFNGMQSVIDSLEAKKIKWGVVTNKPGWLTEPLLEALQLTARAACIVSGDTLQQRKPHPAPLLHACKLAASSPDECVYVGDANRDIEAGRRAGMYTLVALFGYIGHDEQPHNWGADAMIETPQQILEWLAQHDASAPRH